MSTTILPLTELEEQTLHALYDAYETLRPIIGAHCIETIGVKHPDVYDAGQKLFGQAWGGRAYRRNDPWRSYSDYSADVLISQKVVNALTRLEKKGYCQSHVIASNNVKSWFFTASGMSHAAHLAQTS